MERPSNELQNKRIFAPEEIKKCTEVLEAILGDRMLLSSLTTEDRKAFLMAAGKVSRPIRLEIKHISKTHRRLNKKKIREKDRESTATTAIRRARQSSVFVPPKQAFPSKEAEEQVLQNGRNCYVCKKTFSELHFFYDSMCAECAEFNYAKRFQTAPLDGRVALITGSRLKIGYQAALMLLRAGATVISTTRFPHDAALRFSREEDFSVWGHRLQVHGLDLRHSPSVEIFTRFISQNFDRLDILINNAAQTVRRPPGFYAHMMEIESKNILEFPDTVRPLLKSHEHCRLALSSSTVSLSGDLGSKWLSEWHSSSIGLRQSAALSQVPYDYDEKAYENLEVFPLGKVDADLQQVDLRKMNSWRMKLSDVPTPEMLEVQLVNSIAPFILCSKLKPLMCRYRTNQKHIVNVSAMEGKFARFTKTDKHPHTNMAKAALNMMTLTSAADYAKDGIFMNAVDTGWVTDEDPHPLAVAKQEAHDFQPPLDIIDGAARICDPFFHGILTGEHHWGLFLKDYKPTSW